MSVPNSGSTVMLPESKKERKGEWNSGEKSGADLLNLRLFQVGMHRERKDA